MIYTNYYTYVNYFKRKKLNNISMTILWKQNQTHDL
jgi:hypothetical protein